MGDITKLSGIVDASIPDLISLLESLVNVNSWSKNPSGIRKVQDILERELSELGLKVARESLSDGDVLIARSEVSSDQDTLLVGHIDTVHPKDSAFQRLSIDGDRATGPGVLDMKGGVVVMLGALRALHSLGRLHSIPLTVFINHDEEVGSPSSRPLLLRECRRAVGALIFEPGREGNGIVTRRKGVGNYRIEVKGVAAHSGNSHSKGVNAIEELAHRILDLQRLTDYERGVTVNVGTIWGGTAVNTIPERASADFDLRVESIEIAKELREKLAEIEQAPSKVKGASVKITELFFEGPLEESAESLAIFDRYKRAAELVGFKVCRYPTIVGGGSDGNGTSMAGVPTIDGLGPYGEYFHTDKEYILLSSLAPRIKALVGFLTLYEFAPA